MGACYELVMAGDIPCFFDSVFSYSAKIPLREYLVCALYVSTSLFGGSLAGDVVNSVRLWSE